MTNGKQTRRDFMKIVGPLGLGGCMPFQGSYPAQTGHGTPNILFIYLDDLGYGDISCYNPDSRIQTPNIDRIAKDGIIFTDAHTAAPNCGPSRYGLLTGRYPWRRGRNFYGCVNGDKFRDTFIEKDRLAVASLLKKRGYNTAQMGKWGLRHNYSEAVRPGTEPGQQGAYDFPNKLLLGPQLFGFDYSWCLPHLFKKVDNLPNPTFNDYLKHEFENGLPVDPELMPMDPHRWLPDSAKKVIEYLETYKGKRDYPQFHINRGKPFFVYWDPPSPHEPIVPNKEFVGKSQAGEYGDFVVEIDHYIGQMLDALDKLGLSDDTMVIFSSDNGPERSCYQRIQDYQHYSMGQWRGVKRDAWEGGNRLPLIVKWPGVVKPASESKDLVSLMDWMATFADITGQKLPANAGEDSVSFLPLLKGEKLAKPVRETLVYNTPRRKFAIRHNEWVFIDHKTGSALENEPECFRQERGVQPYSFPAELFNLKDDSQQRHNLYGEYPQKAQELNALLDQYLNTPSSRNL